MKVKIQIKLEIETTEYWNVTTEKDCFKLIHSMLCGTSDWPKVKVKIGKEEQEIG